MTLEETLLATGLGPQWAKVGIGHHHGIDISLSSLHSEHSCGIGEFYDLLPLIDWCVLVGFDVIQLLPLNDTGDDPSPFFAISAMALSPLFLSLEKLPGIDKSSLTELKAMNRAPRVSFHDVQTHKLLILRAYFEKEGASIVREKGFEEYVAQNEWVESYALFKVLKDTTSKNHWLRWPKDLQHLSDAQRDELTQSHWIEVCFYIFLQYLCYQQLSEVKEYANKKGVFLKGDIPILISPDSADVWRYHDEFNLSLCAGAPPDQYAPQGQNWGLPIFNWKVMEERDFDWWKTRLAYASNFYDIYRVDHILGFFRIWAIPEGAPGTDGTFIPQDRADWLPHGKEILSTLSHFTKMLPIGEDLGDVPDSVRVALTELGICGTKVMRWERRKNNHDGAFIDPLHYNPISMSTVSTHDSETLTLWWSERPEEAKAYAKQKGWDYTPILNKAERREILWDSHHSSSLFHINLLGEYLALFPELVWENPVDERINLPGTVSPSNWTYRIKPSVEEILAHKPLAEEVAKLLESHA